MHQFISLKWGTKYPAYYVNRLYSMIARFMAEPFTLYCITDNEKGIRNEVKTLPLSNPSLSGWWHKLSLFKKDFYGLEGTILFLDLDVVITGELTFLFSYKPGKFVIIRDLATGGYNSSVFRLEVGSKQPVWDNFLRSAENITKVMNGDQDWLTSQINDAEIWPSDWIVSFKKQCNSRMEHSFGRIGAFLRKFGLLTPQGIAVLPSNAKVVQFHGRPNPADVMDSSYDIYKAAPWIKNYWKE